MAISLDCRRIIQNCYHVPDIREACVRWNALYGIGPFWLLDRPPMPRTVDVGGETTLDLSIALAMAGDLCIELIQSHNDAKLFSALPHGGRQRLHHVAMFSAHYDEDTAHFAHNGCPKFCEITYPAGNRIAYMDARDSYGHFIEILENDPVILGIVMHVRNSAQQWDGKDLIQAFPM